MKKIFKYLLLVCMFCSGDVLAFVPIPPMPPSPVFDGANDGIQTAKDFMKELKAKAADAKKIKDEALNKLKSAGNFIGLNTEESPLKKEEGSPTIASAKDIVPSKLFNIENEEDVAKGYQDLFLKYPTDMIAKYPSRHREAIVKMYDDKRVEFANDSMMELYVSARDLEENRLEALKKELDGLSACFVNGGNGTASACDSASDSDEELGNYANGYKLEDLYDSYLRLYEEFIALKTQYEAAIALQRGVEPFNAEDVLKSDMSEEDEDVSYEMRYEFSSTFSFAQMLPNAKTLKQTSQQKTLEPETKVASEKDVSQSNGVTLKTSPKEENTTLKEVSVGAQTAKTTKVLQENVLIAEPKKEVVSQKSSLLQGNNVSSKSAVASKKEKTASGKANPALVLKKSAKFEERTPFEGAEEQLKALPILNAIYNLLSEAQQMHNTKQQLPDIRNPFLEYERMKALHQVAIGRLYQSGIAVRNYFTKYYGEPLANSLWFGQGCRPESVFLGYSCPTVTGCSSKEDYVKYYTHHILCSDDIYSITENMKKRGVERDSIMAYKISKADKILNMEGDVIGYISEESETPLDLYGRRIGQQTEDGYIEDDQGEIIGSVLDAGLSISSDDIGVAVLDLDQDDSVPEYDENATSTSVGGDNLTNSSVENAADFSLREEDLNRWRVGAYEISLLAKDMQQPAPSYGKPIRQYPVWTDEKRFYQQYLKEKYNNMKKHIDSAGLDKALFNIASQINDAMEVDPATIDSYNKKLAAQMVVSAAEVDEYADTISESDTSKTTKINKFKRNRQAELDGQRKQKVKEFEDSLKAKLKKEKNLNASTIQNTAKNFENMIDIFEKQHDLKGLKSTQDALVLSLEKTKNENIRKLNEEKEKLYAQIDENFALLNEKKTKYNDLIGAKKDAEAGVAAQEQNVSLIKKKKQDALKKGMSVETGLENSALSKKEDSRKEAVEKGQEAELVLDDIDVYQDAIDRAKKRIAEIDAEILKIKKEYIKNAVAAEYAQIEAMKQAEKSRLEATPMASVLLALTTPQTATIVSVYEIAQSMINDFREEAIKIIDQAYRKLINLGDELYDANGYQKIADIHGRMIDDLNKATMEASKNIVDGLLVSNVSVLSKASKDFAESILDYDGDLKAEDVEYFVSLNGKGRDFVAPRRISPNRTAPLREIFHFDAADYDNILKTDAIKEIPLITKGKNPQTTRAEFLKMGQDIPPIWRTILEKNGFVERDVDIKDILDNGEGDDDEDISSLQDLANLQTILAKKTEKDEFFEAKGEKPAANELSELSLFLEYHEGLTFSDKVYKLAKYFEDAENSDGNVDVEELKEKEKMMLARNQIGDYLQFVDAEQTYQTILSQLKVDIDEARERLEEVLRKVSCPIPHKKTGYIRQNDVEGEIVSTEFIADQETYDAVEKCLDEGKNMFVSEAIKMMKNLPTLNDAVADRKVKLDNMIKGLQTDNEELIQLSDNTDPSELEEKIKSERANKAAVGRYSDEAQSAFEKNLNQFEVPYRADY